MDKNLAFKQNNDYDFLSEIISFPPQGKQLIMENKNALHLHGTQEKTQRKTFGNTVKETKHHQGKGTKNKPRTDMKHYYDLI